jgi:regulator of CtrA degradation
MALLERMTEQTPSTIHRKLVDSLYVEAMLLADEARAYFDVVGRAERDSLEALSRVTFSCESLKVTTRLMHIIAWLLTQRAVEAGELTPGDALSPSRRLGDAPETDAATVEAMPQQARAIIATSIELHRRVARLDASLDDPAVDESPARRMLDRLSASF